MINFKQIKTELVKRKEGILIGALVGVGLAWYTINYQPIDLQGIVDAGKGVLDNALGRSSNPLGMAVSKIYIVYGLLGAAIGYYLELLLGELGIGKKKTVRRARKTTKRRR